MNRTIAFAAVLLAGLLGVGTFQNCAPVLPLDGVVDASSVSVRASATPGGGPVTGIGTVINNPGTTNFDGVCTYATTSDAMAFDGTDTTGSLIAFNKGTSGTAAFWNLNTGGLPARGAVCRLSQTGFTVQAVGDFNGDFAKDVLWRNSSTGESVIWMMRGSSRVQTGSVATIDPALNIEGVADFDGDGKEDLLLRTTDNTLIVLKMNGYSAPTSVTLTEKPLSSQQLTTISTYYDAGTFKKKIALFFSDNMVWYMNGTDVQSKMALASGFTSTTTTVNGTTTTTNFTITGIGDFNNDGNADFLIRDIATGNSRIRYSLYSGTNFAVNGDSVEYTPFNAAWSFQGTSRINGDAISDWLWIVNGGTLPYLGFSPVQGTPGGLTFIQYIQPGYDLLRYSHR